MAKNPASNAASTIKKASPGFLSTGFLLSWGFFTILPAPTTAKITPFAAKRAILFLPWVGLALGILAGAAASIVELLHGGQLLAIAVGLSVLALSTGFLHLDGLADTADGLGSGKPAVEALAIMRQSDIGPMGVSAIFSVLALEIVSGVSVHLAAWRGVWAVVTLPMVARISALTATGNWVPGTYKTGARKEGLGALFAGLTSRVTAVCSQLAALGFVGVTGWYFFGLRTGTMGLVSCIISWFIGFLWRRHLLARLGGLTGDTFGSLIEITGLTYLLSLALSA